MRNHRIHAVLWLNVLLSPLPISCVQNARAQSVVKETFTSTLRPVEALGRELFFDRSFSADRSVACANCHLPGQAFSDTTPVSIGAFSRRGTRNAPSLLGASQQESLFWDGRRRKLEDMVVDPLLHPHEHGMQKPAIIEHVTARHRSAFVTAFGSVSVTVERVARSLAAYVRTLRADTSPFDRYQAGDSRALNEAQRRGFTIFVGRGDCARCHTVSSGFTDGAYHAGQLTPDAQARLPAAARRVGAMPEPDRFVAVAEDSTIAALGRFVVTMQPSDMGLFRTPSLRNVAVTPPYMHDGQVATLREAVERELYWRDDSRKRLTTLNPAERADIVAFLESLTSNEPGVDGFHCGQDDTLPASNAIFAPSSDSDSIQARLSPNTRLQ